MVPSVVAWICFQKKTSAEIIESLIQNGARLVEADEFGETVLSRAVEIGVKDIAGLLLDRGADNFLTISADNSDSTSQYPLRAVMDTGTDMNYISSEAVQQMGAKVRPETNPQNLVGFDGSMVTTGELVEVTWRTGVNARNYKTTF
jgi:hypothetical protein